jgi:ATP-dependent Clp protease ATP-binding subunit ClpC
MADTFEKVTERARKVFSLAQEEAQRLNHHYIGMELLLFAIVREGEGIVAGVLESLEVSLEKVRQRLLQVVARKRTQEQTGG